MSAPRRTTQETVLNITMQTPASYYLRGFTGEIYENNRWTALDAETLYPASDSFYWLHQDGFYAQAQIAAAADSVLPELLETKNSLTVENVGLSSRYLYAPYELLRTAPGWMRPPWATARLRRRASTGNAAIRSLPGRG